MAIEPEVAKQLLLNYLSKKKLGRQRVTPEQIEVKEVKVRTAYRLSLETEYEVRTTSVVIERYANQIDETNLGPHPSIWDVACEVPSSFTDSDKSHTMRMPGSGKVIDCVKCKSHGKIPCTECLSTGETSCKKCSKSRNQTGLGCSACSNRGKVICEKCNGNKEVDCRACKGSGKEYQYEQLKVKWTSNTILGGCDSGSIAVPESKLKKIDGGKPVLEKMEKQILPLTDFEGSKLVPERSKQLTQAAAERIAKVTKTDVKKKDIKNKIAQATEAEDDEIYYNLDDIASDARILFQRFRIFEVPVHEVSYTFKSKFEHFLIYGDRKKVYAPDLQRKCVVM